MTEADVAQIEAEVMEWAEVYLDRWEGPAATGCEGVQSLFHPEHVLYLAGGEHRRIADWFDYCMGRNAAVADYSGTWTDKDVRVLSPNAAIFLGRLSHNFGRADGTSDRYPAAAQRLLVERTADGWRITMFENSNGPRAEVEGG
jgi:hypothetical protein